MMDEEQRSELQAKLTQELRRGVVVLAVLSQLDEEKYGYALIDRLASQGLEVDQGTLYPLLRRLEEQGLLQSEWNTEGSRPRRYYQISDAGRILRSSLRDEWNELVAVVDSLVKTN